MRSRLRKINWKRLILMLPIVLIYFHRWWYLHLIAKELPTIKGVNRLLFKESNRALTLRDEFKKMHVEIQLNGDIMTIKGSKEIKGAKVSSHNDHRIAMACAIAGLAAKGNMIIENAEAVKKSYPGFFNDLKQLKVKVSS